MGDILEFKKQVKAPAKAAPDDTTMKRARLMYAMGRIDDFYIIAITKALKEGKWERAGRWLAHGISQAGKGK